MVYGLGYSDMSIVRKVGTGGETDSLNCFLLGTATILPVFFFLF